MYSLLLLFINLKLCKMKTKERLKEFYENLYNDRYKDILEVVKIDVEVINVYIVAKVKKDFQFIEITPFKDAKIIGVNIGTGVIKFIEDLRDENNL